MHPETGFHVASVHSIEDCAMAKTVLDVISQRIIKSLSLTTHVTTFPKDGLPLSRKALLPLDLGLRQQSKAYIMAVA